jgi:hypothetical protein
MRKRQVDLEFGSEILGESLSGDYLVNDDEQTMDLFDKVFLDCEFSINRQELTAQTQGSHNKLAEHYKKLAETATATPQTQVTTDPTLLQKRWNVDPKAGYREFFRSRLAKGITAEVALQEWLTTFPHRNPDCESLMREVAAEFA